MVGLLCLAAASSGTQVESLWSMQALIALVTLTALEIVLGIDNIVFIAILVGKLPAAVQARARTVGLSLAMIMRILLLLAIGWVMRLTTPLIEIPAGLTLGLSDEAIGISGRDVILIVGGLFLIAKSTYEIHDKLEGAEPHQQAAAAVAASFGAVIVQILLLDLVFSLDSVITAVGMSNHLPIMIAAVVIAVGVMLMSAGAVSAFVEKHPTIKMLALSFLLLIGVMLVVEGLHGHIPKGYIYFAMAFSLLVEMMNMRMRKVNKPVVLHESYTQEPHHKR